MRTFARVAAVCLLIIGSRLWCIEFANFEILPAARAQAIPKSLEGGGTENALRDRKNSWTVGVAGGLLSGTYMTFAYELAEVLDDGDNLRDSSDRHLWRRLQSRRPALSARRRCCGDAVGRVRVFPHAAQDAEPGKPSELHHPSADLGDACPRPQRHQQHRGFARQEGQFRSGRKRIELDRVDCVPAARRPGRAGALRQSDRTAEAQVRRDRRARPCDRQADRFFRQDSVQLGSALRHRSRSRRRSRTTTRSAS